MSVAGFERIKRYKIERLLGTGGMGGVYLALDEELDRKVAIKVMHRHLLDDERVGTRFIREARAAAKLQHPSIVTVYEVGEQDDRRYIVMEFVKGKPLAEYLRSENGISAKDSVLLMSQVLSGLHCAHTFGILHRDIKPDNILVSEQLSPKILDFGIAKITAQEGLTLTGDVLGTVEYMAPEQMMGETVDRRCDIYAAGAVLYQLLTLRLPFAGQNPVGILYKILNEEPIPPSFYNPEVTPQQDRVVLKAIARDKNDRWEDASSFAEALLDCKESSNSKSQVSVVEETDPSPSPSETIINVALDATPEFKSVFVGRDKEFRKLVQLFSEAVKMRGGTALISGEAGVGKSTIVEHLATYARKNGAWVMSGACLYQEGMDAYLPFIDAIRSLLSANTETITAEERAKIKQHVLDKIPFLSEFVERFQTNFGALQSADSASDSGQGVFEGLSQLLSVLAELKPVVLIIDDMHWADEASLRLFHYLSRHVVRARILLIGVSRSERYDLQKDGNPTGVVEMLARIRREESCQAIRLVRLEKKSVEELVDHALAPAMLTEEFYDTLYRETAGNPLFVLETLKLMRESGSVYYENGAWYNQQQGLDVTVPHRVEDVFIRRLNALSESEREVLQLAAVVGSKFEPSQVARLLEMPRITLLRKLQRVEKELQIIRSDDKEFQFEHAMLRDLLYNEIPGVLRREYHLMVASDFEQVTDGKFGARVGEVAMHLRNAGEHEKATPLLYQAALRSFKLGAFQDAAAFFRHFMASDAEAGLNQTDEVSDELFLKLGRCDEESGRWTESLDSYELLRRLSEKNSDPRNQIGALERIGRLQTKHGELDKALATYEEALKIAESHSLKDSYPRLFNSLGIINYQRGQYDTAVSFFKRTLQVIDKDGDEQKADALINMGIIANIRANYDEALTLYRSALKIYELKMNYKNQARIHHNIGMTYSDMEAWQEASDAFKRSLALTDQVEDRQLQALILLNMGRALARKGDYSEAETCAQKALKMSQLMGDTLNVAEAKHIFGLIHTLKGNYREAEVLLTESIRINEQKEYPEGVAENLVTFGDMNDAAGDISRARDYYGRAIALFRQLGLGQRVKAIDSKKQALDENMARKNGE